MQKEIIMMSKFLTKLFTSIKKPALLCKKIFDEVHVKKTSNIHDFL